MAQLMRRLCAALLAIVLALLALAAPAENARIAFPDGRLEISSKQVFTPIQPYEYLPWLQKQGPPLELAQVTTNPSVTGSCPPGTETVSGVGEDKSRTGLSPSGSVTGRPYCTTLPSFAVALQTSLVPERAKGDNTATYTRATTAYQIDFEGKHNLLPAGAARLQGARVVQNRVLNPNNLAAWNVTGTVAVSENSVVAPDGTTTAARVTNTDGGQFYSNLSSFGWTNNSITISTWLKGSGTITIRATGGSVAASAVITLSSSWQRFSVNGTYTAVAGNEFVTIFSGGAFGTATSVDVWHPQAEIVTGQTNQAPSEYVSVGVLSAPYHGLGVDGIKAFDTLNGNTVASNVVTEAPGAHIDSSQAACAGGVAAGVVDASGPLGYLSEGARADVLGATAAIRRTMSDVGWVNGGTITVATTTGVDGVAAAGARLTGGAVTATNTILYTTVLGAAVRTYSAWVKRITGTGTIEMTKDGGATWTDITASLSTAVHKLVQVTTASAANPVVGFRITTNADAIDVDFNTLEAAPFANPTPIPINVSKAADVLAYASAGNVSGTRGAVYAEIVFPNNFNGARFVATDSAGTYHAPLEYIASGTLLGVNDTGTDRTFSRTLTPSTSVQKIASLWGGSVTNVFVNGNAGTAAAFSGDIGVGTTIYIGNRLSAGDGAMYGSIRNVRIYPLALNSTIMQIKTTSITDWLGDPFWRQAANDEQYRIAVNQ